MAFVRIGIIFIVFYLTSCDRQKNLKINIAKPMDSIANTIIDSIGELSYENYEAYKDRSTDFIAPLENKYLDTLQRETFVWILINMAYGYQENSRILSSTKYYEKALLYDSEHQVLDEESRVNNIYKPLANNYTILADYQKAENLQLKAIEQSTKPDTKASFYNNLALLYIANGQLDKAIKSAKNGLSIYHKENYLNVFLNNTLTSTYLQSNKIDSAKQYNIASLRLLNKLGMNEQLAVGKIKALENKSQILSQNSTNQLARIAIKEAISLENQYFSSARFREKAKLLNLLAENHLIDNETKEAIKHLKLAKKILENNVIEQNTSSYTKINLLKNLGIAYANQGLDSSLIYFEQAIVEDFAFQQNTRNEIDHLSANLWNRKMLEDIYEHLGNFALADQNKLTKLLWLTEMTKGRLLWNNISRSSASITNNPAIDSAITKLQALFALRDRVTDKVEIQQTNDQIQGLLTKFELEEQYFTKKVKLPNYESFKHQLKSEQLIYSYLLHPDESCSIFKSENGVISYYKLSDRKLIDSITDFKEKYFSTSPQQFNQNPSKYYQEAQKLCSLLLPDLPLRKSKIQLSLDNELHVIPFDALYHNKKFLIQDFDFQYIPSLLVSHLFDHLDFKNQKINVFFRANYDPPFVDLPFVEKEVKQITDNYKTNSYSYTELTSEKLNKVFQDPSIIHVAAHTVMDSLGEVKLLLHQPISSDQLQYFNLQSPLVVLSACNTAAGTLLPSEGIAGINRAFLSRGIPGVIATQWYANDQVTLALTQKFYQNLAKYHSPISALSESKREFLQQATEINSNPWYWANMNYTGLDTTIDLQANAGLSTGYWLFILIVILPIALFLIRFLWKTLSIKKHKETKNKL